MTSSSDARTVLVTGATGNTGRATVKESLALGLRVRALVRGHDERSRALADLGAEIVVGDLLEINTLRPALEGADAAYFVFPIDPGLVHAAVNFAQAVKETGVPSTLNLSQRSVNRESVSPSCRDTFLAEEVFNWSGLDVTHLRPTVFLDQLFYPWVLAPLQQGVLRIPAGQGRCAPVASQDQGRAIAALLKEPARRAGRITALSGPVEMDFEQLAAELSDALGRKIAYQDQPLEEYAAGLRELGLPPHLVDSIAGIWADYQDGRMAGSDDHIEEITGKRSMTVGEFARAHASLLNATGRHDR
ncbi:NmrA family NAD(P)-binding protein [Streptomyces liangshanensis]|uniref:NmrA family NAD(P)-binding protein n=1 Tax=Streptomyces liangshanensis TaxID=2717324 RepID=A0A6G9H6G1_9ACTN|nr:NmrA family NAD(P)-binding protein [Streptomyces liangshanensis]QIQ06080.1 NmrA family NAD(P)-binding protein [Streptomyces liangshanensis]